MLIYVYTVTIMKDKCVYFHLLFLLFKIELEKEYFREKILEQHMKLIEILKLGVHKIVCIKITWRSFKYIHVLYTCII